MTEPFCTAIVILALFGLLIAIPQAFATIIEVKANVYDIPMDGSLQIVVESDEAEKWLVKVENPDSRVFTLDLAQSETNKATKGFIKSFPSDWRPSNPDVSTLRAGTYIVNITGSNSGDVQFKFRVHANTPAEKAITELAGRISKLDRLISSAGQIEDEIQSIKSDIQSIKSMTSNSVDRGALNALERKLTNLIDEKLKTSPVDTFDQKFDALNGRIDNLNQGVNDLNRNMNQRTISELGLIVAVGAGGGVAGSAALIGLVGLIQGRKKSLVRN